MDNAFTDSVSRWHDFYILAGGASATLTGLLFVGVSIHIELIAHERAKGVREIAGQILFNFIYVIVISLTIVSPVVSKELLAAIILIVGSMNFVRILARTINVARLNQKRTLQELSKPVALFERVVLPGACFIAILASGLMLIVSPDQLPTVLFLLMITSMYLIVRAVVDAWNLLIRVAVLKRNHGNVFSSQANQADTEDSVSP